jgi:hypothetical protein
LQTTRSNSTVTLDQSVINLMEHGLLSSIPVLSGNKEGHGECFAWTVQNT